MSINPSGAITGTYIDARYNAHGFLRAPDRTLTTFDPPGSLSTYPLVINAAGTIIGYYSQPSVEQGFLRARNGTFTSFAFPGTIGTFPVAINPAGTITGYYWDAHGKTRGFLRIPAHRDDDTEGDNTEAGND